MPEPTLSMNWGEILNRVYQYTLGGGEDGYTNETDDDKKGLVRSIGESGLRQIYQPPPINGKVHDWSFLYKQNSITLQDNYATGTIAYDHTGGTHELQVPLSGGTWPSWAAEGMLEIDGVDYAVATRISDTVILLESNNNPGADVAASTSYDLHKDDYDLPDDFGSIIGSFSFAQKDNAWYACKVVGENRIRELRQRDFNQNFASGDPQFAAIRAKNKTDVNIGTRSEVLFWPAITSSGTISYRYRVAVSKPISLNHYVPGMPMHAETVLYSCLAEAERRMDGERGVMFEKFMELLTSSVLRDQQDNKPEVLGYNSDDSEGREMYSHHRLLLYGSGVTYKGQGS